MAKIEPCVHARVSGRAGPSLSIGCGNGNSAFKPRASSPPSNTVSPALERLQGDLESNKWRKRLERPKAIAEIGARFDAHLRLILGMAKLQYPGHHVFDSSTTTYNSNIGLQLPVPGGGVVCSLHHGIKIMETEVSAVYGVHGGRPDSEYYRGSIVDLVGLEEDNVGQGRGDGCRRD